MAADARAACPRRRRSAPWRCIPLHPEIVYAGTQSGPYRSNDRGEHWEKVDIADHGLPVWSILFHPHDPDVMFIGYENCEIYRSDDAGEHWTRLPVSVRFPEITTAPGANPAKRVLMLDASVRRARPPVRRRSRSAARSAPPMAASTGRI